jgi:hypothetical protein
VISHVYIFCNCEKKNERELWLGRWFFGQFFGRFFGIFEWQKTDRLQLYRRIFGRFFEWFFGCCKLRRRFERRFGQQQLLCFQPR